MESHCVEARRLFAEFLEAASDRRCWCYSLQVDDSEPNSFAALLGQKRDFLDKLLECCGFLTSRKKKQYFQGKVFSAWINVMEFPIESLVYQPRGATTKIHFLKLGEDVDLKPADLYAQQQQSSSSNKQKQPRVSRPFAKAVHILLVQSTNYLTTIRATIKLELRLLPHLLWPRNL
jgi:hypothetical protein